MTRYEKTKAAILAAIEAADPGAKVYDRWRYPKDTSYEAWLNLFGVGQKIQGWCFSRTGVPQTKDFSAGTGRGNIISIQETWLINGWRTWVDQPPTEYDFQNIVDAVVSQLRQNTAILNLLKGAGGAAVDSIRVDTIDETQFAGERYAHHAQISLIITYPRIQA